MAQHWHATNPAFLKLKKRAQKLASTRQQIEQKLEDDSSASHAKTDSNQIYYIGKLKMKAGSKLRRHKDSIELTKVAKAPNFRTVSNTKKLVAQYNKQERGVQYRDLAQKGTEFVAIATKASHVNRWHNRQRHTRENSQRQSNLTKTNEEWATENQNMSNGSEPRSTKKQLKGILRSIKPLRQELEQFRKLSNEQLVKVEKTAKRPQEKIDRESLRKLKAIAIAKEKARMVRLSYSANTNSQSATLAHEKIGKFKQTFRPTQAAIKELKQLAIEKEKSMKRAARKKSVLSQHAEQKQSQPSATKRRNIVLLSNAKQEQLRKFQADAIAREREKIKNSSKTHPRKQSLVLSSQAVFRDALWSIFNELAGDGGSSVFVEDVLDLIEDAFDESQNRFLTHLNLSEDWVHSLTDIATVSDESKLSREEFSSWISSVLRMKEDGVEGHRNGMLVQQRNIVAPRPTSTNGTPNQRLLHNHETNAEDSFSHKLELLDANIDLVVDSIVTADIEPSTIKNLEESNTSYSSPSVQKNQRDSELEREYNKEQHSSSREDSPQLPELRIGPSRDPVDISVVSEKRVEHTSKGEPMFKGRKWLNCVAQNEDWINDVPGAKEWIERPQLCCMLILETEEGGLRATANLARWDLVVSCKFSLPKTEQCLHWIEGKVDNMDAIVNWISDRLCFLLQPGTHTNELAPEMTLLFIDTCGEEIGNLPLPSPPPITIVPCTKSVDGGISNPILQPASHTTIQAPMDLASFNAFKRYLKESSSEKYSIQPHLLFRAIEQQGSGLVDKEQLHTWCKTLWQHCTQDELTCCVEALWHLSRRGDDVNPEDTVFYPNLLWILFDVEDSFVRPLSKRVSNQIIQQKVNQEIAHVDPSNNSTCKEYITQLLLDRFEEDDVGKSGVVNGHSFSAVMRELSQLVHLQAWECWALFAKFSLATPASYLGDKSQIGFRYKEFISHIERYSS